MKGPHVHVHTQYLKSQCHPKCFAHRGTFFMYEKCAIFLIVVKSDLYLLPSLPLAIRKHLSVNFDLTFKCCRFDFVVYFQILKCFRGGEGDLKIGFLVGVRKVEVKAKSSGLCQSCTAEGIRVSVAEGKKNIYRFQQYY